MELEIYELKYKKVENNNNLRILGEDFVKNHRNKAKLIINNKKYLPESHISINNVKKLKIKLILNKNIYNKSSMFKNCELLESISKLTNFDYVNYFEDLTNSQIIKSYNGLSNYMTNKNTMENFSFYKVDSECSEIYNKGIEDLGDKVIIYMDTTLKFSKDNYSILSEMFYGCKSLSTLTDISKWDTYNVIDMSYMFQNCKLLKSLPDISKWRTDNVGNIQNMFYNCELLSSLPNI